MKNWRFRPISRFISKTVQHTAIVTMEDHALTADSFAVSCIRFGWVHIFRFAMGWVRLGHSVDGLGWVGSPKMYSRTTLIETVNYSTDYKDDNADIT